MDVFKFDLVNPLHLAVISNSLKSLQYLVTKNINLTYALAKPGSYDLSDTVPLKCQLFSLSYCISKDYTEMFKYLYAELISLWRYENLKNILEEVIIKGNLEIAEFVIGSPRTHVLF